MKQSRFAEQRLDLATVTNFLEALAKEASQKKERADRFKLNHLANIESANEDLYCSLLFYLQNPQALASNLPDGLEITRKTLAKTRTEFGEISD